VSSGLDLFCPPPTGFFSAMDENPALAQPGLLPRSTGRARTTRSTRPDLAAACVEASPPPGWGRTSAGPDVLSRKETRYAWRPSERQARAVRVPVGALRTAAADAPLQPARREPLPTFIADILIDDFVAPRTARGASGTTSGSAPRRLGAVEG